MNALPVVLVAAFVLSANPAPAAYDPDLNLLVLRTADGTLLAKGGDRYDFSAGRGNRYNPRPDEVALFEVSLRARREEAPDPCAGGSGSCVRWDAPPEVFAVSFEVSLEALNLRQTDRVRPLGEGLIWRSDYFSADVGPVAFAGEWVAAFEDGEVDVSRLAIDYLWPVYSAPRTVVERIERDAVVEIAEYQVVDLTGFDTISLRYQSDAPVFAYTPDPGLLPGTVALGPRLVRYEAMAPVTVPLPAAAALFAAAALVLAPGMVRRRRHG